MATHEHTPDHQHGHEGHDHEHEHEHEGHDAMDDCIEACLQCHVVTTMTAQYCLAKGGEMADMSHVGLLLDTAEISQTSANFMLRGSPFHTLTCGACAELCRACAEACRAMAGDDEHMAHCAEVCEHCASHCEEMAAEMEEDEEA
jgi:hypothetical protein